MDYLDRAVTKLSEAVDAAEQQLAIDFPSADHPALIRDRNGRFILLDAYAALVNGLAAQENARK